VKSGITDAVFHCVGNSDLESDKLNKRERGTLSLDDHCITTLILCDISKAFDRVWHTGLLLKLKAYGVDGKLFKWFESWNET
jgi:hypothetical protein